MKIEMGESLVLSWLRHIEKCQLVQLNWKVSNCWEGYNSEEAKTLYENIKIHFPVFKNNSNFLHRNPHTYTIQKFFCPSMVQLFLS